MGTPKHIRKTSEPALLAETAVQVPRAEFVCRSHSAVGRLRSFLYFIDEAGSPHGGLLEGSDFGLHFGFEELGELDGLS